MSLRKPLLVFDGDCGFCRKWIAYWQGLTGGPSGRVDYVAYQESANKTAEYPELTRIPPEAFAQAVQLIEPDGTVSSGARAVFTVLAVRPGLRWLAWLYRKGPGVAALTELAYGLVARHRVFFSRMTRLLWGEAVEPSSYRLTRWLYFKALGITYLAAFVSFWTQASGLVGPEGILPSDWTEAQLHALCAGGVAASLLLISGLAPLLGTIAACGCYWFVSQVGQEFMSFQWDALMVEMGFFSIFLAFGRREPFKPAVWLLRWLLFRVMFFSGYVKLASHDPHWRDLTALRYHFETQPLPTWIGWGFDQLPLWALKGCALGMFAIELGVPFLYFLPRKPRIFAFFATVLLQLLIDATGNYGFFGWQVCALAILLWDDVALERLLPRLSAWFGPGSDPAWAVAPRRALGGLLVAAAAVGAAELNLVHSYGVFAVMTTERRELVFEGSRDGRDWQAYELPCDPARRPAFCEPRMPRLDWQLWFAALGSLEQNPWVEALAIRLLQGSAPVLGLFDKVPFPDAPPQFVRARFYRYHFTDIEERRQTGRWWDRELLGDYLPPVSLKRAP